MTTTTSTTAGSQRTVLPNTARLIALMLAGQGVEDADERVLHQLMDFSHRYTTDLLTDAKTYANHAGRPGVVETSDVELAVQTRSGYEFTEGAPKDFLLPLAKQLNRLPLPTFSQAYTHILLPPPNQMLGHVNFNLVPNRTDGAVEGLYEGFDSGDEGGWGSEDIGSSPQQQEIDGEGEEDDESRQQGVAGAREVGEEDGDDVDMTEDVKPDISEERGQKRSLDETDT